MFWIKIGLPFITFVSVQRYHKSSASGHVLHFAVHKVFLSRLKFSVFQSNLIYVRCAKIKIGLFDFSPPPSSFLFVSQLQISCCYRALYYLNKKNVVLRP